MRSKKEQLSLKNLISEWQQLLSKNTNWKLLIKDIVPNHSGCGLLYELPNFLKRPDESLAIADMRQLVYAEPHYHPDDNYEIYFVLQGTALIVVGKEEIRVSPADIIIIPPNTAHFTIPDRQFVIAAVNTPAFKPECYLVVTKTNAKVRFDRKQFDKLSKNKN